MFFFFPFYAESEAILQWPKLSPLWEDFAPLACARKREKKVPCMATVRGTSGGS